MSRSGDGKCPDIGQWCGFDRVFCDGNCTVKRIEDLEAENERLKSALKPVMEFDALFGDLDEFDCCECKFCQIGDSDCWRGKAIRMRGVIQNARRIYNGGEA